MATKDLGLPIRRRLSLGTPFLSFISVLFLVLVFIRSTIFVLPPNHDHKPLLSLHTNTSIKTPQCLTINSSCPTESCIPLFNFSTVYDYLTNSKLSFINSFDDPRSMGRGRYNKRMAPIISIQEWRKGSQWFAVNRKLAMEIVLDEKYYEALKEHCRPPCYMDEHYLPTLVTKLFPAINSNRSLTLVDWSSGGSHPKTFKHKDVSEWLLKRISHGPSNCSYNANTTTPICSLFARKFDSTTLGPLMRIAPKLLGFHS